MTRHESPAVLTRGQWVRRGLVQVWQPAPELAVVAVLPVVACRRCGALSSESCRSKTGRIVAPHVGRETPRLCPCGGEVAKHAKCCDSCRIERRRTTWRKHAQQRRDREAAA